jgi:hypothetical protein
MQESCFSSKALLESPAASRASARWRKYSARRSLPSRIVQSSKKWISIGTPLSRPRPVWRTRTTTRPPGAWMCSSGSWARSAHPPELLHERNHLRNAPEMLRSIRVGPPVTPDVLDIGMQEVRELFARHVALHERVERVTQLAHSLEGVLGHRFRVSRPRTPAFHGKPNYCFSSKALLRHPAASRAVVASNSRPPSSRLRGPLRQAFETPHGQC